MCSEARALGRLRVRVPASAVEAQTSPFSHVFHGGCWVLPSFWRRESGQVPSRKTRGGVESHAESEGPEGSTRGPGRGRRGGGVRVFMTNGAGPDGAAAAGVPVRYFLLPRACSLTPTPTPPLPTPPPLPPWSWLPRVHGQKCFITRLYHMQISFESKHALVTRLLLLFLSSVQLPRCS